MKATALHNANEVQLVSRCMNNDAAAQKLLYEYYVADMMLLCLRYIAHTEDAREVLMDGFYAFFTRINTFEYQGAGSVKAWLKKIMVNSCLMFLRKRQPVFADKDPEQLDHAADDDAIISALSAKELLQLIHTLPDGCRAVFNLYVFEDTGHAAIGELLGISESTSKSQLHRAKAILKKKILKTSQYESYGT